MELGSSRWRRLRFVKKRGITIGSLCPFIFCPCLSITCSHDPVVFFFKSDEHDSISYLDQKSPPYEVQVTSTSRWHMDRPRLWEYRFRSRPFPLPLPILGRVFIVFSVPDVLHSNYQTVRSTSHGVIPPTTPRTSGGADLRLTFFIFFFILFHLSPNSKGLHGDV